MSHPVVRQMHGLVGSLDLQHAENTIAYTILSGRAEGSFAEGPLRPLGSVGHVVLQIMPYGQRPILRTYMAGFGEFAHEAIIGSSRFNTTAFDLSGVAGRAFPGDNVSLADAATRMLRHLAAEPVQSLDDVQTPMLLAVPHVDQVVIRSAVPSKQLTHYANRLLYNRNVFLAPVSGVIVGADVCAEPAQDFMYLKIMQDDGQTHDMLIPSVGEFTVAIDAETPTRVETGECVAIMTKHTPRAVVAEFAWHTLLRMVPAAGGGEQIAIPLAFLQEAIRGGHMTLDAVWEDTSALLGGYVRNPCAVVMKSTGISLDAAKSDAVASKRLRAEVRRVLGPFSKFATEADVWEGLHQADAEFFGLSGMGRVQSWAVKTEQDLRFRRPGAFVDFMTLRQAWRGEYGPMDPSKIAMPVDHEAAILRHAVELALQARDNHDPVAEVAAAALGQNSPNLRKHASMVKLLQHQSGEGSDDAVIEYLERMSQNDGGAPDEAARPEVAAV